MTKTQKFNLSSKLWRGLGSPVTDISFKDDSLPVHVFIFLWNFGGSMWLCSGEGERLGYKRSGFDPTVTIFSSFQ